MVRLVLSGYYGFDNVGDEAILYSIIQSLREYHPKIEIVVLSHRPKNTAETFNVEAVNRWSMKDVTKALKNSDGLISGGGSLLQDETSWKSIPYYAGIIKLAQLLQKPVFVYAQGMGPFKSKFNRFIVRNVLNSAKLLTVRDSQSKNLLESIGVNKNIKIVPDPVIGLNTSNTQSAWMKSMDFRSQTVAVSIRDWSTDLSYLKEVALALDELSQEGFKIILIPMHGIHDYKSSEKVKGMMTQEVFIAPHNSSIQEKIDIIKESDILIGMRLHALIFASIGYTPFVALSYDPKVDSFAAIVDQQVVGNVNEKNWTHQDIVSSVVDVFGHYSQEVKKLKSHVVPLQEIANNTAKSVINSLK